MTATLGAELGHLGHAGRSAYDDVRLALLDAVIAAEASGHLEQAAWETAFGAAVRSLRMRVVGDGEAALRAAAAYSRYPARQLRKLLPDAEIADALLHRLLAEAMPLERFEGFGEDPVTRRARAAALDEAWEGAVRVATAETVRWRATAARVAAWRRPTGPLWITSGVILVVAVLLASWLSGVIASPGWFRPINDFWWRLWP